MGRSEHYLSLSETPSTPLMRRWFDPLQQMGTSGCAANLTTQLSFLTVGDLEIPLTINSPDYCAVGRSPQCWIVSPWTHYVAYAAEEMQRVKNRWVSGIAPVVGYGVGQWLRWAEVDQVIMINNWLLSTCPWDDRMYDALGEIINELLLRWPEHGLVFRSLNRREAPQVMATLHGLGARIIPSRQVWYADPTVLPRDLKKDWALLDRGDLAVVSHDGFREADFPELQRLYDCLYLQKYSLNNPQYTTSWLIHLWRENLLQFTALRNLQSGRWLGVEACGVINGVLTSPIIGYDTSLPQELGLYRRLASIPMRRARREGLALNLSSGVGSFKAARGCQPEMEYLAVFDRHLPRRRRQPWAAIEAISQHLLAPWVKKHRL